MRRKELLTVDKGEVKMMAVIHLSHIYIKCHCVLNMNKRHDLFLHGS